MHLRDHDARKGPQRLREANGRRGAVPVEQGAVAHALEEVEVETRRETGPRAPCDDRLDLLVGANDFQRREKGVAHGLVPAIALFGPVERDARHARVLELVEDELRP